MRLFLFRAAPRLMLVGLLLVAGRGGAAAGDFDRYLSAAVNLYENLEYERALEQLGRAKRLASGVEQDVAVALHEGLVYADMGRRDAARAAFHTALSLDPEAKLPLSAAPKVVREFESVRARVRRELARRSRTSPRTGGKPAPAVVPAAPPPSAVAGGTDRPERTPAPVVVPESTHREPEPFMPTVEAAPRSRLPVVPVALLGAGVVAAGVGTYFGLSSRSDANAARDEKVQIDSWNRLEDARGSARVANVLFATAGLAATGAVVAWLLSPRDESSVSQVGASR
ncbi:tetratricopeptide repeat protein [Myxococcus sp. RHSTA-1-4]|uniref:tetratricopeptide repeat protein n=1 Tax=Myxococcus sp. RHSTA-1-4 TaxID=2874601 RepID=UPI001CC038B9|nr:tetratricopeptide repeat protein [Myxococcus sp. RHSTA-1-4]MBZ4417274.1 tetratricopeptide repeat protein [Myxococcus sp. RHSTA-1-4]